MKRKQTAKLNPVKQYGEVFTPTALVNEMLDRLETCAVGTFKEPAKTFCDPSCGDGQFLIEVLRRKMGAGIDCLAALRNIYGVDVQERLVNQCRARLFANAYRWSLGQHRVPPVKEMMDILQYNIRCADALNENHPGWLLTGYMWAKGPKC